MELFAPVKVETIPLLTPNMDLELMREPWTFPREPASCAVVTPIRHGSSRPPNGIDGGGGSKRCSETSYNNTNWEENFQDLSGWCMANAHSRCEFPAGESPTAAKLTGTRNDGSDVLIEADGSTRGFLIQQQQQKREQEAIEKKNNINNNNNIITTNGCDTIASVRRSMPATCVVQPQLDHAYTQAIQQQKLIYTNNISSNDLSAKSILSDENNVTFKHSGGNVWMGSPKDEPSASNDNNIAWQEYSDLGIIGSSNGLKTTYQQPQPELVDLEPKRDSQDVFQALDADASIGFDLLSYLCEDDIPSPNDSISTDSSRVTDVSALPRLSDSSAHIVVSPKTYEPITLSTPDPIKSRLQSSSPFSNDSPKNSPTSSTRQSSYQLRPIVKIEPKSESPEPSSCALERRSSTTTTRTRRTRTISTTSRTSSTRSTKGRGRKRTLETESDDDDYDDDGNYRETREKNNEASRKSRMNKKAKEVEMSKRAVELEKDNRILKMKVEELEKLVTSMRNALLRSALKRDVKTNMF